MWALVAGIVAAILVGCESSSLDASAAQRGKAPTSATATASDLDRLLAPIALYPDQLIAQMLLSSTMPAEVEQLHAWLASHATLKGSELQDAATVDGFDPSLVALALFPQVVGFMAERIDWTTSLGRAFTSDRSAVFDSIQRLRAQAHQSGALKDTPQQEVETKVTESGAQVIVIEPANPQIIYVPQYDPQVVYAPAPTTVVVDDSDDAAEAAVAGLIGFTAGIALGAAVDNDYYYGPYGWRGGVYMYNDAWDDWSDAREDAREDWIDHREELVEERGDRARAAGEQRTDRVDSRQDARSSAQGERTERQQNRQENRPPSEAARQARPADTQQARPVGTSGSTFATGDAARAKRERSGTSSDAFSGYSSGRAERAASARGQRSRSGGGGGGGGGRRR